MMPRGEDSEPYPGRILPVLYDYLFEAQVTVAFPSSQRFTVSFPVLLINTQNQVQTRELGKQEAEKLGNKPKT